MRVSFAILFLLACAVLTSAEVAGSEPTTGAIRSALDRAIPLIRKSTEVYPEHRECFSCHHQAVPALAFSLAKVRGFAIEEEALQALAEHTLADLESGLEDYKKGRGQPGGTTRAGYALFTLDTLGHPRSEVTDAVAGYFLLADKDRDHWRTRSNRPPSEASDFTASYLAARGLRAYGTADQKKTIDGRIEDTGRWLKTARVQDTEDRVFRLFAAKAVGLPVETIREFSSEILKTQNPDGGWAQLDGKPSDAYATGSALVAIHQAGGVSVDDPAYRRGLGFLVDTQRPDGSWLVSSRSKPFQLYFESGFPHEKDQFISIAGSSWAASALLLASPRPTVGR
jgi:Prenyltransferase and squalene oxidase repeat